MVRNVRRRNLAPLTVTAFATAAAILFGIAALAGGSSALDTSVVEAASHKGRQAGAILFHERGCEHCHGVEGVGTELGPNLETVGKRLKKSAIERQILQGGDGMPAFANVLNSDETASLVAYLHAKRKAPRHTTPPPEATQPKPVQPPGTDPGL